MAQDIKAGGAYVELMLKNKRFTQGLKSSGKQLLAFGKMAVVAGAAMAAAAVAGAAVAVRQYIKMGDQLDKMAQRTGVSVEALSELKHAAGQSGTSIEAVEKAIRRNQRTLYDANRGLSTASDGYRDLGLNAKELAKQSPEDQFNAVAEALAKVDDQSRRSALAQQVLGRSGAELLPMVENMAQLRQEARDMGITMSTEAAQGAARLLDAFSIVGSQMKTFAFEIGGAVAPLVEMVMPTIQRFGAMSIGVIRGASEYIRSNIGGVVEFASNAWQSYYNYVAPAFTAYATLAYDAFTAVWDIVKSVWDAISGHVTAAWGRVAETTGGVLSWMQETVLNVLSSISFAFKNWRLLVYRAAVGATLGVVQFAAETAHVFTEVIPAYLKWFFENWRNIFTDVANMTKTVATNIGTNIYNLWKGVQSFLSGDGFKFEWTDLTEGFESAMKELPQIAARQAGPIEKALQYEFNRINAEIGKKWEGHQAEFKARIEANTPDNPFSFDGKAPNIAKPDAAAMGGGTAGAQGRQKQVLGAFSLAALQGGAGGSYERKTYEELRAIRKQNHEALREQRRMNAGLT